MIFPPVIVSLCLRPVGAASATLLRANHRLSSTMLPKAMSPLT